MQLNRRDDRDAENEIANRTAGIVRGALTGQANFLTIANARRHCHGHAPPTWQVDYALPSNPSLFLAHREGRANVPWL